MSKKLLKVLYFTTLLLFLLSVAPKGFAQTGDYSRIESKARRFFDNGEWANANAMYVLMLEERPRVANTYAHAIVSNIMSGDTIRALDMVTKSMTHEVPLDTLLTEVRTVSFSIGKGKLYEQLLLDIKSTYPWLSRIADNYLMRYYAFRRNGPELIRYAQIMLAGLPDSREFLRMAATGYLLTDHPDKALELWHKVVDLYPDDYETILDLANCYDALGNKTEALKWMERACEIRQTPFVKEKIAELQN